VKSVLRAVVVNAANRARDSAFEQTSAQVFIIVGNVVADAVHRVVWEHVARQSTDLFPFEL
jgi:hypothetical protein